MTAPDPLPGLLEPAAARGDRDGLLLWLAACGVPEAEAAAELEPVVPVVPAAVVELDQ